MFETANLVLGTLETGTAEPSPARAAREIKDFIAIIGSDGEGGSN